MMVVMVASEQSTGATDTVSATFSSSMEPSLISSKNVIQEDRSVLELLHAGQMVHQLRRQGLHV